MPTLVLTFPTTLNISLQKGDTIYVCPDVVSGQAGRNHPNASGNTTPVKIGPVTAINRAQNTVDVLTTLSTLPGSGNQFALFSKDRRANYSGVIGYFMEVEYRNYSTLKSEIFATAVDYVESSR